MDSVWPCRNSARLTSNESENKLHAPNASRPSIVQWDVASAFGVRPACRRFRPQVGVASWTDRPKKPPAFVFWRLPIVTAHLANHLRLCRFLIGLHQTNALLREPRQGRHDTSPGRRSCLACPGLVSHRPFGTSVSLAEFTYSGRTKDSPQPRSKLPRKKFPPPKRKFPMPLARHGKQASGNRG